MNLIQYVTVIFMAQAIKANTIGQRLSTSNNTRTDEQSNEQRGISAGHSDDYVTQNNRTVSFSETEESLSTNIDSMTSSETPLRSVSSPKFDSSLTRIKRGRSPRKKKCDPTKPSELCRKKKKPTRKHRKGKRKRCKRKGKGRKKGCNKSPKVTPKPPPFTIVTTSREACIRTRDCPPGHCCARHHGAKVCKPMKKENEICARPRRKERRNLDHFGTCECEEGLACRKTSSRLYTCQRTT